MTKQRAILLGANHPRALAMIQTLGAAGVCVIAIDQTRNSLGFYSRHVNQKFSVANCDDAALALLERLGEEGGGVIIPTNDEYLILVSKHYHSLSRRFILTTPPWDLLESLMDIPTFYGIAQSIGVTTPAFFKPQNEKEMINIIQKLDFQNDHYLLKTRPGTVPADRSTGRFTKVAGAGPGEMKENCLEIYSRLGDFPVIVKVIPGEADRCIGVCMVINKNQEALVCYCVRRLRLFTYSRGGQYVHPYVLGANVFCESVHDEEAVEMTRLLVERTKYFGPMALEFRRDSRNERLTLIKADPRPVRATSLSTALGMDISLALYQEFTSKKSSVALSYPDGVAWIWVSAYLTSLWENRRNRPILKELFSVLRKVRQIRAIANLNVRDPLPFLMELKFWWLQFRKVRSKRLYRRLITFTKKSILLRLGRGFWRKTGKE